MSKQEVDQNYVPSKYSKFFNLYTKNYMKWINPFLNCISKSCQYGAKYPIFKVLKAISKIFLLNEIEIIFLAYMIKQTNWDIKEKLITNNYQFIQDVVCYSSDQPEYKSLILYLMIVSYSVKFYLNEETKDVLEQANKICPNFKAIFQNWAKKHATLTKRINPKTLNKVYQILYMETRKEEPDFNMIVDAIIQISPAYNPEKNEVKKKQYAEIKREPIKKVKNENLIIITNSSHNPSTNQSTVQPSTPTDHEGPAFCSSALHEIAAHGKNMSNETVVNCLNSFNIFQDKKINLNKSGNFLGSSVVGMPKCDIRDRDDDQEMCSKFFLGMEEGQSEENIIIQDCNNGNEHNHNFPHTSVIDLKRGVSAMQKYLADDPSEKNQD